MKRGTTHLHDDTQGCSNQLWMFLMFLMATRLGQIRDFAIVYFLTYHYLQSLMNH